MRRRAVIYLCVLAGALGALWLPTSAQGPARPTVERVGGRDARAREVLVRFRGAQRASDLNNDGDLDAETVTRIGRTGIYRLRSRSLDAATLMARLARRGDVEYEFLIPESRVPSPESRTRAPNPCLETAQRHFACKVSVGSPLSH